MTRGLLLLRDLFEARSYRRATSPPKTKHYGRPRCASREFHFYPGNSADHCGYYDHDDRLATPVNCPVLGPKT